MSGLRGSLGRNELVSEALVRIPKSFLSLIWLSLALPQSAHHNAFFDKLTHVFIAMSIRSLYISVHSIIYLSEKLLRWVLILCIHFISLHIREISATSVLVLLAAHYILANIDETW